MLENTRDREQLRIVYLDFCFAFLCSEGIYIFKQFSWFHRIVATLQDVGSHFLSVFRLLFIQKYLQVFKPITGSFPWLPHTHTAPASSTPPPTSAFKSCSSPSSVRFTFT